jgi:hypothetical protein
MTRKNPLNNVLEQPHDEASVGASETSSIDERMMRSIQQNYQVSHQEEFLKLRIQTEALLMELRQFAGHQSEEAEFTL